MRDVIRSLVADIEPLDSLEAEHRSSALAWIDSGAELIRQAPPATPPKHLVSYCLLVDSTTRRALLVDHRDAELWLPTGGHVDPDEHPAIAAQRELAEELQVSPQFAAATGASPLFVTVTQTVGISESHVDVSLWFVFDHQTEDVLIPDDGEFAGVAWWDFDDIVHTADTRFDPHLPRFIEKLDALR